ISEPIQAAGPSISGRNGTAFPLVSVAGMGAASAHLPFGASSHTGMAILPRRVDDRQGRTEGGGDISAFGARQPMPGGRLMAGDAPEAAARNGGREWRSWMGGSGRRS